MRCCEAVPWLGFYGNFGLVDWSTVAITGRALISPLSSKASGPAGRAVVWKPQGALLAGSIGSASSPSIHLKSWSIVADWLRHSKHDGTSSQRLWPLSLTVSPDAPMAWQLAHHSSRRPASACWQGAPPSCCVGGWRARRVFENRCPTWSHSYRVGPGGGWDVRHQPLVARTTAHLQSFGRTNESPIVRHRLSAAQLDD